MIITVAAAHDLAPGEGTVVEAGGKLVGLFNVDGRFYAVESKCLHRGGPLGEGDLEGTTLTCPWHGWQYDVTTGRHLLDPSVGVRSFHVVVEGDEVKIDV